MGINLTINRFFERGSLTVFSRTVRAGKPLPALKETRGFDLVGYEHHYVAQDWLHRHSDPAAMQF